MPVGAGFALLLFAAFQALVSDTFARSLWPRPESVTGWIRGAASLMGDAGGIWSRTIGTIPRELTAGWLWLSRAAFLVAWLLAIVLGAAARSALSCAATGRTSGAAAKPDAAVAR